MKGVLDVADSLLIVSSASIDGARSASATLDWLDAHGYRDLVSRSVAVINYVRRSSGNVDLDRVSDHFAARCRAVVRLPFDPHLEEGAEIELDKLASPHPGGAARARGHRRRRLRPGRVTGAAPDDPPIEGPPHTTRGAPRRTGTPLAGGRVLGRGRVLALGALDPLVERAQELRVVVRRDQGAAGDAGEAWRVGPVGASSTMPPGPPSCPAWAAWAAITFHSNVPTTTRTSTATRNGITRTPPASSTSPAADAPRTGHPPRYRSDRKSA